MSLQQYIKLIEEIDRKAMERAQLRWNAIAKPLHSLGVLEQAVIQIAGIRRNSDVKLLKRAVVVMCADNGVVTQGVTQVDNEVTAIVAENLTKDRTCINQMARIAKADVKPVDIAVARELIGEGIIHKKICYGTKDMTCGPAMTVKQAEAGILVGIELVKQWKQQGYDIIATGEMGIGNTTTSSAMTAVLLQQEVSVVTGRGAGLSSEGWAKKVSVIQKAIDVNRPDPHNSLDVLAKVGGLDIAGLVGIFLGGSIYKIPIVIDGFISAVAALTATRIHPLSKQYMLSSHLSKEPASQLLMEQLQLEPIIHGNLCLGEGTGAVALFPLLDMALAVYENMSQFEEVAISPYQPLI